MILDEFQRLHDNTQPDDCGCRRWPLSLKAGGYPQVTIDGNQVYGHRVSLELKLGRKIRPRHHALHICDRKWCFSQDHLYEGTNRENVLDRMERQGFKPPQTRAIGERHGACKISEEQAVTVLRYKREDPRLTAGDISHFMKIPYGAVSGLLSGRTWRHLER